MPRSSILRLADISETINGIVALTANMSYEQFAQNWAAQRAVERGLEIISEATRHIPDDDKALAPEIPWRQIAAIENLLRHEYQRSDSLAIWNILAEHLPRLKEAVDRLTAIAHGRGDQREHR